MKLFKLAAILCVLTSMMACSTSTPGGKRLYDDSEPPSLLDAEIRMDTLRRLKGDKSPDVRTIQVQDGVLTCSLESRARKLKGSGPFPMKEYSAIWRQIDDLGWFGQKAETPDPSGSYYHAITFRLGPRLGQTSAQNRTNFLGLGTTEIQARLRLSNMITRAIEEHVELENWVEEEAPKKP
ncbi:MAG: hypothetical protein ACI97A_001704 [Planctomycetota bacterium]